MKLRKKYIREYRIWKGMRSRCNAPCFNNSTYQKKGIKCCRRWNSFEHFLSDMGPCPENYTLDRIDNNGNYCPSNCHWVTRSENRKKTRNTHYITMAGETHNVSEWCEILHISKATAYRYLNEGQIYFINKFKGEL